MRKTVKPKNIARILTHVHTNSPETVIATRTSPFFAQEKR